MCILVLHEDLYGWYVLSTDCYCFQSTIITCTSVTITTVPSTDLGVGYKGETFLSLMDENIIKDDNDWVFYS